MSSVSIEDYYGHRFDEDSRLAADDFGPLEFERSKQIISNQLPGPPGVVLDIGGGTGPYSVWLLESGYEVHLIDKVAKHVDYAFDNLGAVDTRRSCSARLGDARDLPYGDKIANAALLFGPLYHLQDREDRLKAIAETHRCLKPGGVVFAAAISRYASLIDGLNRELLADADFAKIVERDLEDGCHLNPGENPLYFTTAYFHHPDELVNEMKEAGFNDVELYAVEGPLWAWPSFWGWWQNEELQEKLLALLNVVEQEPSLIGASPHIIAVGRV